MNEDSKLHERVQHAYSIFNIINNYEAGIE